MPARVLDRVLSTWRANAAQASSTSPGPASAESSLRGRTLRPPPPSIVICALVFTFVFFLWRAGQFQFFELQVYDRFLKSRTIDPAAASEVVVVGVTERDLHEFNSKSVPDAELNDALQNLTKADPAAIVVDFYRDLTARGEDPSGRERLAATFAKNSNIIAIQCLGLNNDFAVPPPPFLADLPEQVGFNNFGIQDKDVDNTVRRVALIMWEDGQSYFSDPLLATLLYLQTHDIDYSLESVTRNGLRLGGATIRRFESNDGPYVNAEASGYQIVLDYREPAKFPTYSLMDAIAGKIPVERIRGNVVLVGPLAGSLKDFHNTPIKKVYPGLMLHAHTIDQLLRYAVHGERQVRFWPAWQEAVWLLLWAAVGTLVGSNVRSPFVLVPVIAGCLLVLSGTYWLAMLANLWLLVVAPAVGFACAAGLSTAHQAYLEKKERDTLMRLFSQHVSANIATDIWRHRDQFMEGHRPKPQVLTGTVFFSDLKGFTGMAETLLPDVLMNWLNEYMEIMAALIEQHSGMVNKYMGDAIMAVFGAPIPRTNPIEIRRDAENAVRCALAMGQQLDALNRDWEKRGLPTTTMRIGIATGPLVSGSIGGSKRLEYTVTGDTVVIAKRLESAEKDSTDIERASLSCRILIAEETSAMLGPQFRTRAVGPMRLEGKHRNVGVCVVIGHDGERPS